MNLGDLTSYQCHEKFANLLSEAHLQYLVYFQETENSYLWWESFVSPFIQVFLRIQTLWEFYSNLKVLFILWILI